jgi:hypothetical protein
MGSYYDSQRITLDPGRTALALRALRGRDQGYPFVEQRLTWRRRTAPALRSVLAAWFPTVFTLLAARG